MTKAYKLTEDVYRFPINMLDQLMTSIKNEKLEGDKLRNQIDQMKVLVANKGDILFRSRIYPEMVYPQGLSSVILQKKDKSFGLGVLYEGNILTIWRDWLKWEQYLYTNAKWEEIEYEGRTFEQVHIVGALEGKKRELEITMNDVMAQISNINGLIDAINK